MQKFFFVRYKRHELQRRCAKQTVGPSQKNCSRPAGCGLARTFKGGGSPSVGSAFTPRRSLCFLLVCPPSLAACVKFRPVAQPMERPLRPVSLARRRSHRARFDSLASGIAHCPSPGIPARLRSFALGRAGPPPFTLQPVSESYGFGGVGPALISACSLRPGGLRFSAICARWHDTWSLTILNLPSTKERWFRRMFSPPTTPTLLATSC